MKAEHLKRLLRTILFAALLAIGLDAAAGQILLTKAEKDWIKKHPVIRVGMDRDWAPVEFVEDGAVSGFAPAYTRLLGEKLGIKFQYVYNVSWAQIQTMAKKRQLDMLNCAYLSKKRRKFLLFTRPMLELNAGIFTREDYNEINSLSDLGDKKIAIVQGNASADILKEKFPNITIIAVNSTLDALLAVRQKKADAVIEAIPILEYTIRENFLSGFKMPLPASEMKQLFNKLYIAVRKDYPMLVRLLNKAMLEVEPEEYQKLKKRWLFSSESAKELTLTEKEKSYLAAHPVIRACAGGNFAPIFMQNKGIVSGIGPDLLKAVTEKLGIKLRWTYDKTLVDAIGTFKRDRADVMPALQHTLKLEDHAIFTKPYISIPCVIVTHNESTIISFKDINTLKGKTIALAAGTAVAEMMCRRYPYLNYTYVKDTTDGLHAVEVKKAAAYIGNALSVNKLNGDKRFPDLLIAGTMSFELELSIAVNRNLPLLASAIQKSLDSMSMAEKNRIIEFWIKSKEIKSLSWQMWLGIIVVLGCFLTIAILWNRLLKRTLAKHKVIEHKFEVIFEQSADAHLLLGVKGVIDCNRATLNMLKAKSKDEIIGRFPTQLSPEKQPDGSSSVEKYLELSTLAALKESYCFEWTFRKMDGQHLRVEVTLNKLSFDEDDNDDEEGILLAVWHDITARTAQQSSLETTRKQLRLIIETAPIPILLARLEGDIFVNTYVNKQFVELFGWELAEIPTSEEWFVRAYPDLDYRYRIISAVNNQIDGGLPASPIESKVRCKSGEEKIIEYNVRTFDDQLLIMGIDKTEIRELKSKLKKIEK